jgi:hypothetical protein
MLYVERLERFFVQGKFVEAARAFSKAGAPERAVALFTDLRQFELAKQWALELGASANLSPTSVVSNGASRPDGASNAKVAELIAAQAAWSEEVREEWRIGFGRFLR